MLNYSFPKFLTNSFPNFSASFPKYNKLSHIYLAFPNTPSFPKHILYLSQIFKYIFPNFVSISFPKLSILAKITYLSQILHKLFLKLLAKSFLPLLCLLISFYISQVFHIYIPTLIVYFTQNYTNLYLK